MIVKAIKTSIFSEGDDLFEFITRHIPKLKNGSILVVTSKIVALSEGRVAEPKNKKEHDEIIRRESSWALKTKQGTLTEKGGVLMWNAGADESNTSGKLILLPRDSFKAAQKLHSHLLQHYKIRMLGVILSDSRIMPRRAGVVGIAIGYAGFKGTREYRGKEDLFGREYHLTQTDVADSLASAAVLLMGEGSERQPLCVIENAPVEFTSRVRRNELVISRKDDMYAPLFKKISGRK